MTLVHVLSLEAGETFRAGPGVMFARCDDAKVPGPGDATRAMIRTDGGRGHAVPASSLIDLYGSMFVDPTTPDRPARMPDG